MTIKQLTDADLRGWVDSLLMNETVIGPQSREGHFILEPLKQAGDLRLDYDTTVLPPKKYFLPPKEVLLTFHNGDGFKSVHESDPFVLFGIHPWDMLAIDQMDRLFNDRHPDSHYNSRRKAATLVVMDPQTISPNNFAGTMGAATAKKGWDVLLTKVGEVTLAESSGEKGDRLLRFVAHTPAADESQVAAREKVWAENRKAARKHELMFSPDDLPDLLGKSYDNPIWEERAQQCLSCGSCNLVCPTCYCFDVQDDVDWSLSSGSRSRAWDGCLLRDFAAVAGGHNFRKHSAERFRHRFFRKAKYIPEKIGEISCVGCGRCIDACVAKISNPVEIYNLLWEAVS